MKKLFFVLLCIIFSSQIFAQDVFIIRGHISDSTSLVDIPYATVSLTNNADSLFIKKMASSGDGKFEISVKSVGDYLLTIESIGYEIYSQKISTQNNKLIDLGKIQIKEVSTTLNAVQISAMKPLVKVEADKITYNTESDPEAKSLNALDLLRKVPLISVDGDDNVKIKGNGNFKIHINGRPSSAANSNQKEFLRNLPASSIKNIEVITSPGAKYDAEGVGGILNIITNTKSADGYNGSISTRLVTIGRYVGSIYFSATKGKFSFSTNLSGGSGLKMKNRSVSHRDFYSNPDLLFTEKLETNTYSNDYLWGNGEMSYEIDSLNLISGSFDFYAGTYRTDNSASSESFNSAHILNQSYRQNAIGFSTWSGPAGNLNYQHQFKKNKEQLLTFSYLYNSNANSDNNKTDIINILNITPYEQQSINDAIGSEHTFQADFVYPFQNKDKLETGIKYIYRLNKSETDYFNFDNDLNQFVLNDSLQTDFNHTQNIEAFYISYNKTIGKFGTKAGARLENSIMSGTFESEANTDFTNRSFEIVPSASISYNLSEKQSISMAYNMRIQRPDIWYLNPYINTSDRQNISYGNPNLDPERFHNINLNYNFFGQKLSLSLSFTESISNNAIDEVITIDSANVATTTYYNINKISNSFISANINWRITPKISFILNGNLEYSDIQSNITEQTSSGFGEGAWVDLQYKINQNFKISANAWYHDGVKSLQSDQLPFFSQGMTVSHDFLKNKLTVSLSGRNLFNKEMVWRSEDYDTNFYQQNRYYNPGRMAILSISYRFGEMKQGVKKVQRGIDNDDKKAGGKSSGGE